MNDYRVYSVHRNSIGMLHYANIKHSNVNNPVHPGVVWEDGSTEWYIDGRRARPEDCRVRPPMPKDSKSAVWVDSPYQGVTTSIWVDSEGRRHREPSGDKQLPAVECTDGYCEFWIHGKLVSRCVRMSGSDGDLLNLNGIMGNP